MDRMKSQAVRWGTRLIEADAEALDLTQRPYKIQVDGQTVAGPQRDCGHWSQC